MSFTNELHPYKKPNVKLLKTKAKARNTYNRKRVNEVSVDAYCKAKKKRKHRSKLFINSMIIKEKYRLKGFTQLGDR